MFFEDKIIEFLEWELSILEVRGWWNRGLLGIKRVRGIDGEGYIVD